MTLVDINTSTITSKGQITLPAQTRQTVFPEGGKVAILAYSDHVEIRPLTQVEERLGWQTLANESLDSIWNTPEEDAAWEHLQSSENNIEAACTQKEQ